MCGVIINTHHDLDLLNLQNSVNLWVVVYIEPFMALQNKKYNCHKMSHSLKFNVITCLGK